MIMKSFLCILMGESKGERGDGCNNKNPNRLLFSAVSKVGACAIESGSNPPFYIIELSSLRIGRRSM